LSALHRLDIDGDDAGLLELPFEELVKPRDRLAFAGRATGIDEGCNHLRRSRRPSSSVQIESPSNIEKPLTAPRPGAQRAENVLVELRIFTDQHGWKEARSRHRDHLLPLGGQRLDESYVGARNLLLEILLDAKPVTSELGTPTVDEDGDRYSR
jgi:hypothetical protein